MIKRHSLKDEPACRPQANDNDDCAPHADGPFDEKAWRRAYMKKYMREWRRRVKARGGNDAP
jgi:hypothetical protein